MTVWTVHFKAQFHACARRLHDRAQSTLMVTLLCRNSTEFTECMDKDVHLCTKPYAFRRRWFIQQECNAWHFHRFNVYVENFQSYVPLYLYVCWCLVCVCQTYIKKLLTYLLMHTASETACNYPTRT